MTRRLYAYGFIALCILAVLTHKWFEGADGRTLAERSGVPANRETYTGWNGSQKYQRGEVKH